MRWRMIAVIILAALIIAALVYEARFFQARIEQLHPAPPASPPSAPAPAPAPAPSSPATQASPPTLPPSPATGRAFLELFDHIDSNRWDVSERPPNGSWQENEWRADRLAPGPGGLVVSMVQTPAGASAPLASGEIFTRDTYAYGYFEVRWRVPRGQGVVSGAFTYAGQEGRALPQELDIEILGRDTRTAALSFHVAGHAREQNVHLPFDAADGLHNFAIEWTPRSVRWYIDDDMVWEADDAIVQHMTKPERIMLNLWGTEGLYRWAGHVNPNAGPWQMSVACVAQAREYPGHSLCPTR